MFKVNSSEVHPQIRSLETSKANQAPCVIIVLWRYLLYQLIRNLMAESVIAGCCLWLHTLFVYFSAGTSRVWKTSYECRKDCCSHTIQTCPTGEYACILFPFVLFTVLCSLFDGVWVGGRSKLSKDGARDIVVLVCSCSYKYIMTL